MMREILILTGTMNDLLDADIEGLTCCNTYKNDRVLTKILRNTRPLLRFSFDEWRKNLAKYSCIIVFDESYKPGIIRYIRNQNKNARIILRLNNTVKEQKKYGFLFDQGEVTECCAEVWSYSLNDCKEYGFKYNCQFWNEKLVKGIERSNEEYDFSFIGQEKGRLEILDRVYDQCLEKGWNHYFYLVGGVQRTYNKNISGQYMAYKTYLNNVVSKSKILLDIVSEENYGLTLRPLEALFMEKKLVTNYQDIVREPFYNPNNIFILKDNNIAELEEFMQKELVSIKDEIKEKYDCKAWIARYFS